MRLTVFTPLYNRANKLLKIYDSLSKQNCNDFEWLIVDDGSSDGAKETVEELRKEKSSFYIRYIYQDNGGKHRAYNTALKLAEGEYFFCLDSDDWLNENAISNIFDFIVDAKLLIVAYKENEKGVLLSDEFPKGVLTASFTDLYYKYRCLGEFTIIFKTSFARQFPFPEFDGEKFLGESVIYDRMIDTPATLLPTVITICEYQSDGLSANINNTMKKNPAGYCLYFMQRIDIEKSFKQRIVYAGKYNCFKMFAKKNKTKYIGRHKFLVVYTIPLGLLFWLYYKIFRKF